MGFDPASKALMAGMLGSSAIGGLTAPQGQKLKSFDKSGGVRPEMMLSEGKNMFGDIFGAAVDAYNQPVKIKTTVNPLPSFVGGGLPMPIAAPGMDPNRLNPALRETQHPQIPKRRLTPGPLGDTGRTAQPRDTSSLDQAAAAAELLLGGGGDDRFRVPKNRQPVGTGGREEFM